MNLQQLDAYLRSLPATSMDIKWGADWVWSVGARMYAACDVQSGQAGALSFKVPDELFLSWTAQPGIVPAPYLARARWVQLQPPWVLSEDALRAALRCSWALVAARLSRKLRLQLGIADVSA